MRQPAAITDLERAHVGPLARTLAASFDDDGVYHHLIPDERRRARALPAFFRVPVADAVAFGASSVAIRDGEVLGGAVWLPPGAFPHSTARRLRALPGMLAVALAAPGAVRPLAALGAGIERAFPAEPVWYLEVIGVDPRAHGEGVGTALMEPGLARADAAGLPAYLETAKQINVGFYERLGFSVLREGLELVPGAPTFWLMRREPGS
jgi:ribosomal protein S18 acetylase RimI-like enzyme